MPIAKLDHAFCLTAQCEPGKRKTDLYDPGLVKIALNGSFC